MKNNIASTKDESSSLLTTKNLLLISYIINILSVFVLADFISLFGDYSVGVFSDYYNYIAKNILDGHGYRFFPDTAETLLRSPGYPLFLAVIFKIFGENLIIIKIINIIFVIFSSLLLTNISLILFKDKKLADISTIIFLLHPGIILAETRGAVEVLFMSFMIIFIFLGLKILQTNKIWIFVAFGLCVGAASVVRSTAILFPFFFIAYLMWLKRNTPEFRTVVLGSLAMLFAMSAVLSPWVLRNYSIADRFVPTMSVLGVSAHQGLTICKNGSIGGGRFEHMRSALHEELELATKQGRPHKGGNYCCGPWFYSTQDELEFTDYLKSRVVEEYIESPQLFLKCVAKNAIGFWVVGGDSKAEITNIALQIPFLFFTIAGLIVVLKRGLNAKFGFILLFLGYFISVHLPIITAARMSVPLVPLMSLFAAAGLLWLWRGWRPSLPSSRWNKTQF